MRYIHRNEWLAYGFLVVAMLAVSLPLFPYRWRGGLPREHHRYRCMDADGGANAERQCHTLLRQGCYPCRPTLHPAWCAPGTDGRICHGDRPLGGWGALHQLSWITVALWLLTASGVIWVGILIPVQHRMAVFSDPTDYPDSPPSEFFSALRKWYFWGALAIALPLCSLYLMVNKPTFG